MNRFLKLFLILVAVAPVMPKILEFAVSKNVGPLKPTRLLAK